MHDAKFKDLAKTKLRCMSETEKEHKVEEKNKPSKVVVIVGYSPVRKFLEVIPHTHAKLTEC